jgi:hypothetical protein
MITVKQAQKLMDRNHKRSQSEEEEYVDKKIRESALSGGYSAEIDLKYIDYKVIDKLKKMGFKLKERYGTVNHGCGFKDTYQSGYRVTWGGWEFKEE